VKKKNPFRGVEEKKKMCRGVGGEEEGQHAHTFKIEKGEKENRTSMRN